MFYYSPASEENPVTRQLELTDNVIPSSNSTLAALLFHASVLLDNNYYMDISRQMLINMQPHIERSPSFFANWLSVLLLFKSKFAEIVISGPDALLLRQKFTGYYLPNVLFAGTNTDITGLNLLKERINTNETFIYVCKDRVCKLPVKTVEEALKQLVADS